MSPIKYFGKRSAAFGKPLWEIVLNLKEFGKGRIVQRTRYTQVYPDEPTFYKILRVEPHSIEYPPGRMLGNIWTEVTFRGRKYDEPLNLGNVGFTDDFQLIPKHEEAEFCNRGKKHVMPIHILPRTAPFPPVWAELLRRQQAKSNDQTDPLKIPELPLVYNFDGNPLKQVAAEGEEPTVRITPEHTRPRCPELYDKVILDRAEAKEVFDKLHNSRKYLHSSTQ